jgi:plastocyanin
VSPSSPLTLTYVGLGFDADSVRITMGSTQIVGGFPVTVGGAVWVPGGILTGVPVGFQVADSNVATITQLGVGSARITGRVPVRDSTWVYAETPTHLRDSVLVRVVPPPAQLQKQSGDNQTGVVGSPFLQPVCVTVRDGLNGPVPGVTVNWTVGTGTAGLSSPSTVSDAQGIACVLVTPQSLGSITVVASSGTLTPVTFSFTVQSGTIRQVILSPAGPDTIARTATLQYSATLRDSIGNIVGGTVTWSSTVPAIASVNTSGLAIGLAPDSTRIIASAGGYADTAWLFVRGLRSVAVSPADTVITAVNDSVTLSATALDNFGDPVTAGVVLRYLSATPTVAQIVNNVTGRVRIVGPGNAVVVARDSASGVQGTATLRVVQTPAAVANTQDSIQVGIGGRGQVVAQVLDRKGFPIPGRTLGWQTRATAIATVDQTGMVTGVALGPTYVVDSLVDGANVFKDSTLISVVPTPPALIQWAFDSTAVGNGGNLSVALSLTRPPVGAPLIVKLTSSDTMIARPSVRAVTIPQGQSGTSVTVNGLAAGRVTLVAQDSSGLGYLTDSMVVTVVSTIEFREIGSFSRQPNFYVNNNETRRAQVFLSDPAPAGGLGVTFVYGSPGRSLIAPAPAIIPAGQLAADIVISGLAPGRDSVIPTSGGFVGRYSIVNVAPESLLVYHDYTPVVGLGQIYQPYVMLYGGAAYAMDHPLIVSLSSTPAITTHADTVTIPSGTYYRYFNITGTALGSATLTASAPGWIPRSVPIIVSTPRVEAFGTTSMVAGDPNPGYWGAYTADSLFYQRNVADTVTVTAVSRNPGAVVVDSPTGQVLPNTYYLPSNRPIRALPGAGGDSAWIVVTAPSYMPDSFKVYVQRPTITFTIGYPYTGRVPHGTLHQNAAYVQIPYARTDTFWVVLGHTQRGILGGPDSVPILPGTTYSYFDVRGDSLGVDTVSVQRATGYVVSGAPIAFRVDRPRVALYNYPSTLYTISAPTYVTAAVMDSLYGYQHPLLAPLTINLVSRNPSAFTLDSATVVIPAGATISNRDTLRVVGVDSVGSRIVASAVGAASDSSPLIRVLPTPLGVSIGYPYTVGRGLVLPGSRVYVTGGTAPDTIRVALAHTNPGAFALSTDTVVIPRGQTQSTPFDITALDSVGTDSIIAAATNYVTGRAAVATQAARLDVQEPGASQLTTDPPQRLITYTETRNGYALNPSSPVTFTIVSSNPSVIQIDSAGFVNGTRDTATSTVPTSLYYGYFKVRYVGSGTARLYVSAPGFDTDSTQLVTVTGPTLHLNYSTVTIGQGQVFTSQRVYVDNAVASPLTVRLLRSDSTLPPASQAFALAADSVVIPTGQAYSPYFDIIGNVQGAAQLIARADGYSQAVSPVQVVATQLEVSNPTLTLYVGERIRNVTTYTEDANGTQQYVAAPLVVASTSSDPTIARSDSATRTIAARASSTFFPIKALRKGSVDVVFSAAGYKSDTTVVTVDTAKLSLNAPAGPGPGQQAVNAMSVSLPYSTDSLLVVTLTSTNPAVLTVPPLDTILAGGSSASFTLTGVSVGTAQVIVTAPHSYPDTQAVTVGTPRLFVSLGTATNAGQQYTITVYTQDSLGNNRPVAAGLPVTLVSSSPLHTVFGSNPITVGAGSSSQNVTVIFDTAGTHTVTATAAGYTSGVATTTTTGAMVRIASDLTFTPPTVTIPVGRSVTWRNFDAIAHTSTSDAGVTPAWNSGNIAAGGQYVRTFTAAGSFAYHCNVHPGMTGTVVVQ